tara:strand:- start:241 stop:582 length:342 start_codon:yes stop_codon:yes gene_type:complete
MNLTWAYILLVFAILFELISTSFLKDTNGFTRLYPSLIVVVSLCFCLYLISHTMKVIPVGIVYASWAGLGIVGITIIASIKYNQVPNIPTIIGLLFIVIGVVIVHLMNDIKVD